MVRGTIAGNEAAPLDAHFHTIDGGRAFESVVDQITFGIRSGVYRPGTRLPTVQELTEMMGVSKPVIIEAVRVLSEGGVVQAQRGATGGITVVSDNIPVTLLQIAAGWREAAIPALLEARRAIEVALALLAGERATEGDLAMLRSAVDDLETQRNSTNRYAQLHADHLFHYGIGRAARSEMLAYYQHQVLAQLAKLFNDWEADYSRDEGFEGIVRTHRDTLDALISRDPELIRAAMDAHLAPVERSIKLSQHPAPAPKRSRS